MKARGLINWCVMLLWFVATHHCAFEQLTSGHEHRSLSQTALTFSDSSFQPECPSHPAGDSSSHSEGRSCGTLLFPSSSSQLHDATPVALVPFVSGFFAALSRNLSCADPFFSSSIALFEIASSEALSQRAHSLSIAPNAPPVTLA